jgi:hypothetical protein
MPGWAYAHPDFGKIESAAILLPTQMFRPCAIPAVLSQYVEVRTVLFGQENRNSNFLNFLPDISNNPDKLLNQRHLYK